MSRGKTQTMWWSAYIKLFVLLNIITYAHGKLGKSNVFVEDSNENDILDGDYIVVFAKSLNTVSTMNADDVSSMADKMTHKYALEKKNTLTSSLYGFTATNLTKQDLRELRKEGNVRIVEKDVTLSIDLVENKKSTNENKSNRRLQGETIPNGVRQVGWKNVEYDDIIMNRRVFIIDSGVSDPDNELNIDTDMARNFVQGEDPNDWSDCNGHGTHIAGTIAAKQNGRNVVGVAAGAVVVPIRVLNCVADGSISQIVAGINYVVELAYPGDVINISVGGRISQKSLDIAVENAAWITGAHIVVAAGNEGVDAWDYSPARVDAKNVYTVCALSQRKNLVASFSNYGKPPIQVCAPGTSVTSLSRHGGLTSKSGTSMAAPHVSGALLMGPLRTKGFAKSRLDGRRYKVLRT